MPKKLLVAMDDSENSLRSVDFIIENFSQSADRIVLFSVLPDPVVMFEMSGPELTSYFSTQQELLRTLQQERKKQLQAVLDRAKGALVTAGFVAENIAVKLEVKKIGVAQDIVEEASHGYDMILMGRRGLSGLKEFFLGSVSQKVVHLAKDITVVIVN